MTVRGIPLRQHSTVVIGHGRGERSFLKSFCLSAAVFSVPARLLAVWPPSTSLAVESEVSNTGAQTEKFPTALHQDVRAVTDKLQQGQRRLEKVIQDLKDDEAALKKLTQ